MTKVSVLMPAYNGEKYIAEAIESVIKQTSSDWEMVIADDVSTDKTAEIAQTYVDKHPGKVKLIRHTVNKGQAGALNTALSQAKGTYICTLDVDDVYEPTKLEEQIRYLDEHKETAMVYSNGYYINSDGSEKTDYNSNEYDPQMLHRFNLIPNGSVMIRRLVVLDAGGFDESLRTCQDYDLWLRVQNKGYKIEKMPIRSYSWRQHKEQKSRTKLLSETLKLIHEKYKHTVVSIVVPAYNAEKTLKGCLDSILSQKCHDYDINQRFEVLVIDDASTDKTGDIVREYLKDDRFRYFRNEENMGIGYTRNRGIDEAKGDFICFLSADDEFLPDYVLAMIKTNQVYPDAVLYSDYLLFNDNGNICGEARMPSYSTLLDLVIAAVSQAELNKMFVCYNCFAPAKIWRENKFDPDFRFGEDLEHLLRVLIMKRIWFVGVQAPLFKYRVGFNTTTTKKLMDIPNNNKLIKKKINGLAGRTIFEVV